MGSYDVKYMRDGLGSVRRIKMEQDEKHGKLPSLSGMVYEHTDIEDGTIESNSSVVFTLSASYLSLPKEELDTFIHKFIKKPDNCKINQYLECSFK